MGPCLVTGTQSNSPIHALDVPAQDILKFGICQGPCLTRDHASISSNMTDAVLVRITRKVNVWRAAPYRYTGGYWEARETGDWSSIPPDAKKAVAP